MHNKFILFFAAAILFSGCSYILTKNKADTLSYQNRTNGTYSSHPLPLDYYLRYYNFQHANSTVREAQLEFMVNGTREIQALVLPNETVRTRFCDNNILVRFDNFADLDYNMVYITVTYLNKTEQFNISKDDKGALNFSCNKVEKVIRGFTAKSESKHIFIGNKEFTLDNDIMSDNSCIESRKYNITKLKHAEWHSRMFDAYPELRRYMFRPNTFFCIGNKMYILEEDQNSLECYTNLGKRGPNTIGCKNLEGIVDKYTGEESK